MAESGLLRLMGTTVCVCACCVRVCVCACACVCVCVCVCVQHQHDEASMAKWLGVQSIGYLSPEGLISSTVMRAHTHTHTHTHTATLTLPGQRGQR